VVGPPIGHVRSHANCRFSVIMLIDVSSLSDAATTRPAMAPGLTECPFSGILVLPQRIRSKSHPTCGFSAILVTAPSEKRLVRPTVRSHRTWRFLIDSRLSLRLRGGFSPVLSAIVRSHHKWRFLISSDAYLALACAISVSENPPVSVLTRTVSLPAIRAALAPAGGSYSPVLSAIFLSHGRPQRSKTTER
jgi:hypothetical protein